MQGIGQECGEVDRAVGPRVASEAVPGQPVGEVGGIERQRKFDTLGIGVPRFPVSGLPDLHREALQYQQSVAVERVRLVCEYPAQRGAIAERELHGHSVRPDDGGGGQPFQSTVCDGAELGFGPRAGCLAEFGENACGEGHLVRDGTCAALLVRAGGRQCAGGLRQHGGHHTRLGELDHCGGREQKPHPAAVVVGHPDQRPQVQPAGIGVIDRSGHRGAAHRQRIDLGQRVRGQIHLAQQLGPHAEQVARFTVGPLLLPDHLHGLRVLVGPPGESGRQQV